MSWAECRAYGTRISFRPFSQDFRPGLYYDVPAGLGIHFAMLTQDCRPGLYYDVPVGLGTHFARLTQDFRVCVTTQKSR
jgi:hypothetical protein